MAQIPKLSDFTPGSSLPPQLLSLSGKINMLKPIQPGEPLVFGLLATIMVPDDSATLAGRANQRSAVVKFTTGSFTYPTDLSGNGNQASTSTSSVSSSLSLAQQFEEIHGAITRNNGKEVVVVLREPGSSPGAEGEGGASTLVTSRERHEMKRSYTITIEMSRGLAVLFMGEGKQSYDLWKEFPSSWFSSIASQEAPPCAQPQNPRNESHLDPDLLPYPQGTSYTDITEPAASIYPSLSPIRPAGFGRITDHEPYFRAARDREEMRDREERSKKEAEGSRTAVRPRDDLVGEEIVGPDIRGQEGRPEKRRKLALTSSDEYESNGNGQIGKGKGKGQEGDRAGRWKGKGKENAVDARQGEAGGLPKRFVAKPEPVINQEEPQRRSLDPVTLMRGRSEPEVRPPPQAGPSTSTYAKPVYRPRTYEELSEWASQPLPRIVTNTRGDVLPQPVEYKTIGSIGGNEKEALANETLPNRWDLFAVINQIERRPHRVGWDWNVGLQISDPTRHDNGDYLSLTLFSQTEIKIPERAVYGSVIMIRNAHPSRFQGSRLTAKCAAKKPWSFAIYDNDRNWTFGEGPMDPRIREGFSQEERDYMVNLFEWQKICHSGLTPDSYNPMYHGPRDAVERPVSRQAEICIGQSRVAVPSIADPSLRPLKPEQCSKEIYTEFGNAKVSTLPEVIACEIVPWHFRIQESVNDTAPTAADWDKCIVKWCNTCKHTFRTGFCHSCEDQLCKDAEYRFRFWVILGEEENMLPVQIWHPHIERVLPRLPKIVPGEDISEVRLKKAKAEMLDMLLGKKNAQGQRSRLPIDWSIEAFWMTDVNGDKHRMFRAFEMV